MKKKLFRERWYGKPEEKKEEVKKVEENEVEEKKPAKRGRKKND